MASKYGGNRSRQTGMTMMMRMRRTLLQLSFLFLVSINPTRAYAQCTNVSYLETHSEPPGFAEVFRAALSGDIYLTTGSSARCATSLFKQLDKGPYINTTRITWTVAPNLDKSISGHYLNYTRVLTKPSHAVSPLISGDENNRQISFTHTPAWINAEEAGVIVLVPAHQLRSFDHFDQTPSNVQLNRGFLSIESIGITSSSAGWGSGDCFPGETLSYSASLQDNQVENWDLYINSRASDIEIEAPFFHRTVIDAPNSRIRLKGSLNTTDRSYENIIDGGQEGSCFGDDFPGTHVEFFGNLHGQMQLPDSPDYNENNTFPIRMLERTRGANVTFRFNARDGNFACIPGCKDDACLDCQPTNDNIAQSLNAFPCVNSRESYRDRLACSGGAYYCNCFMDRHAHDFSAAHSVTGVLSTILAAVMALGLTIF